MSEYPGVRRATVTYLLESVSVTAGLLVVMGVCCGPILWLLYDASHALAGYALFAYLGLCVYLGQRNLDDGLRAVDDVSDSGLVAWLLAVVIVLYYNVVVVIATALAASLSAAGLGDWALAVTLLYPFFDAEMARQPVPLSVAGGLVTALVVAAWLAERLTARFGVDADETIDHIRRLGSTRSLLQDYLLEAYDRRRNRGASH